MNERGKTFFSKSPNNKEIILGGIRLLLELFVYWNKSYGTDNNQDPLHAYRVMYATLAERINFPENLLYIKKEYNITDDFHLMPPPSLPMLDRSRSSSPNRSVSNSPQLKKPESPTLPASGSKTLQNPPSNSKPVPSNPIKLAKVDQPTFSSAFNDVIASINSGCDYKQNSPKVFRKIQTNSKDHNTSNLKTTHSILESKDPTPASKLYAVFLLKLTETKNNLLVSELASHQGLLNKLFLQAQADRHKDLKERGKSIFSATPSSDEARQNYLRLIIESFIFWKKTFPPTSKSDPVNVLKLFTQLW